MPKIRRIPQDDAIRIALESERIAHADARIAHAQSVANEAVAAKARAEKARADLLARHGLTGSIIVVTEPGGAFPVGVILDERGQPMMVADPPAAPTAQPMPAPSPADAPAF